LPGSAPGTPAEYLQAHQRVGSDDKLLFAFIDWLLPHLRLKQAQNTVRWDDFWRRFKSDGTMGWDEFEKFLRWDCKLNARRLFDLLDEHGTGRISSHTVLELRRQYFRIIDCRHLGLGDLKAILLRKYGNLLRAWRLLFDPEQRGRCSHAVYVKGCKEVGFHGDLKCAWSELTDGEIHRPMYIQDLDPAADRMMHDFTEALRKHYGSPKDGWYAVLRAHGAFGRMTPEAFETVCLDMGFGPKFAKKVFAFLDLDLDRCVSLDEWDFLQLWERRMSKGDPAPAADAQRANVGGPPARGKGDWQAASGDAAAAIEFLVVLTKEEHKEYLNHLREFETKGRTRPQPEAERQQRGKAGGPSALLGDPWVPLA